MKRNNFLATVTMLLAVLFLVGCADEEAEKIGEKSLQSPEEVVESFEQLFFDAEFKKSKQYVASTFYDEYSRTVDELIDTMEAGGMEARVIVAVFELFKEHSEFEITGHTIDGDQATVYVIESNPDEAQFANILMAKVQESIDAGDLYSGEMTEEDITDWTLDLMSEAIKEVDVITEETEVEMVKEGGVWKITEMDLWKVVY